MAQYLELIDLFKEGESSVCAQVKFRSDWSGLKLSFGAFSSRSVGQPNFPLSSS